MSNRKPFILEMLDISKSFPGAKALRHVSLQLYPGEIHALVGENGAGKSTLMKILSGAYQRDSGRILLDGREVEIAKPSQALQLGIATIYQEANLAPRLTVAENVYMGRAPAVLGIWVNWAALHHRTQQLLQQLGANFTSHALVKELSPAQQQMVEITKALSISAKVIVLDEPTASLAGREVSALLNVMRQLRERGVAIVFITHRLEEVSRIADRVTVMRDGVRIATHEVAQIDTKTLVAEMVGREVENLYFKRAGTIGNPLLRVNSLSGKGFSAISFDVRAGEIVGLFGLVGARRTDVARALFGAARFANGTIMLEDVPLSLHSPADAIKAGLVLAPEDRKQQGLVLGMSVQSNISLPSLRAVAQFGILRPRAERSLAVTYKGKMNVRCPSVETIAKLLSGGNQQKVVIAKWLATSPKILILDEPTRGIDVGGKAEVHRLMTQLTAKAVGILMISSDLLEVLSISDRVLVMHEGRLAAEINRQDATEENVMFYATGQHLHAAEKAPRP
jgi:rhamnose transport system ATP-binding protein